MLFTQREQFGESAIPILWANLFVGMCSYVRCLVGPLENINNIAENVIKKV